MRQETKVIQLANDPKAIERRNEFEAIWGWAVLGLQITDQKIVREGDSYGHQSSWSDEYIITTEVITEHTNYATITYQRDLDDPRIQELADLEKQYQDCCSSDFLTADEAATKAQCLGILDKKDRDKLFAKICLGGTIVSLILSSNTLFNLLFYMFVIATVVFWGKAIFSSEYKTATKQLKSLHEITADRRSASQHELMMAAKRL